MQVPILEVSASATVSILWQVDVGFYDELPWVQQQIVKGKYLHIIETCRSMLTLAVWQIVTSEEEVCFQIE